MRKVLTGVVLAVALAFIAGCKIQTPEIRGVVLDAESNKPVKAWVIITADISTRTVQGKVSNTLFVGKTWTDDEGKFVIPSKSLKMPAFLPPLSFGSKFDELVIRAHGSSGLQGERYFYRKGTRPSLSPAAKEFYAVADIKELQEILKREELKIYAERPQGEYFGILQHLYIYCTTGRYGVAVMKEECDMLDFLIEEHERYLERNKDEVEKDVNTVVFDQLAYLYEEKGDYERAIETLRRSVALIERRGMLKFEVWQRNKAGIEHNIKRLEQLQLKQQPQP